MLHFVLYGLYWLYVLCVRSLLSSGHWNSNNQPNARAILHCITVWFWVIPNTMVFNGFTAIHFPPNPFTAAIAWTWSWSGRLVSIMAALLCRQIQSGMLRFCCCSLHLLWLTLDPSPSNAHSYQRWKHTMILRMVIISINYIMAFIASILIIPFQAGWNLLVPWFFTSLTTRNQFYTSSQLKVSWENCQWFLSVTPEPFRTACAIVLRERQATAGRVPGTDARCGLSIRGLRAGPAICNEGRWGWRHIATWECEI